MSRRRLIALLAAGVVGTGAAPARAYPTERPRLVALDWAAADTLLALDIEPLAVCDVATYRQWLPTAGIPTSMLDLGSRAEPNMELLVDLKPDAILISNWQNNLVDQLEKIAPTVAVTIVSPKSDPLQNVRTELLRLAGLYGREHIARQSLASFDSALSGQAAGIARNPMPPIFVGVLHENGSQLFLYGEGSWVHSLLPHLGLRNALARPTSAFGNALVDLAVLAEQPDAILLYLDQDRTRRAERALRRSTLWHNLPIVRAGNVRAIAPFYPLGGILSVARAADVIAYAVLDIGRVRRG